MSAAALALVVPYSITLGTLWATTGAELTVARYERGGTTALRPLVRLIAATADAQSAAVAGNAVNATEVRAGLAAVDAAQAAVGGTLGTARRWADVRSRVGDLLAAAPRGLPAYTRYSQVVDLELDLVVAAGDASNLILDPQLDSYYLMDAALVRTPAILVGAGRAADLTLLDERRRPAAATESLASGVTVDGVRQAADRLDAGLRKSFAATASQTLGPGLLTQLDGLQDAVAQLAPPLAAVGATELARSAVAVQSSRTQVRDAVLRLEVAALDQLDRLLDDRARTPRDTRRLVLLATLAGLLVAGAVAWVLGPRRAADPTLDAVLDPALDPTLDPALDPTPDPPGGAGDLMDARELLAAGRLLRVGRAVTDPARERR